MAILFYDGFDFYTNSNGSFIGATFLKRWVGAFGGSGYTYTSVVDGAYAGKAISLGSSGTYFTTDVLGTQATLSVAFQFKYGSYGSTENPILRILDRDNVIHLEFRITSGGYITVYRGGSVLLGTSSSSINPAVWTHLEIKVTINDSTGAVTVYSNGTSILSLSTQDTQNGGYTEAARVRLYNGGGVNEPGPIYDNLIIHTNSNPIGNAVITTYTPDADGTYTDFTCSTGADHYALVDEVPPSETDYTSSNTLNAKETFSFGTTTAIQSNILAVQPVVLMKNIDGGTTGVTLLVRSGLTPGDTLGSTEVIPSATSQYFSQVFEQDPKDSVTWTPTKIDSAEFGVKITTVA